MSWKSLPVVVALGPFIIFALQTTPARADTEADLLKKFSRQNQSAGDKLKQGVESQLAQAAGALTTAPERALKLLRQALEQLQADTQVPRDQRADLVYRAQTLLQQAQDLATRRAEEEEAKRLSQLKKSLIPQEPPAGFAGQTLAGPEMGMKPQVRPPILGGASVPGAGAVVVQPNLVPFQNSGGFQVTPVVSPDRRFVRIGVSGSFNFVTPGPFVPTFTPVPTILQGPGRGLTVVPPFGQLRSGIAPPRLTNIALNTTVVAPDGGGAVVGGYSSFYESRSEGGIPVLGKVPYLSRLFRNVSSGGGATVFQVNVRPRIISLEEEEQRFLGNLPPLPDR